MGTSQIRGEGQVRGAQASVAGTAACWPSGTVPDWPALSHAVDEIVESLREALIGIAQALIRIPSINHPPTGEERACQLAVAAYLRRVGLRPEVYALDDVPGLAAHAAFWPGRDYRGRPNVVARRPGQGGGRSLLLSGHIDTVPLGTQPWHHDPFGAEIAAGRLYGLGAYDMKGGVAAILGVMRALAALAVPLQGDLIVETVVDEEFGGVNGTLAGLLRGDHGDAVVIPEPSNLAIHNGVRGGHVAQIRLVGQEGIFFGRAEPGEAIRQLTHLLQGVDRFRARRRAHCPDLAPGAPDPVPVWVTKVAAGGWGTNVPITVPAEAQVELSWQLLPGEAQPQVEAELGAWLDEVVAAAPELFPRRLEVHFPIRFMPASAIRVDHPFVQTVAQCARVVTGETPAVTPLPSPSDLFVVQREFGLPSVHYGVRGANAHAADEYLVVDDLVTVTKVLTLLALTWCGVAETDTGPPSGAASPGAPPRRKGRHARV